MLSHTAHRSWVVGCCMEQQNLPVLQPGVSHSRQHNHTVMSLDMTKDRIHKLFRNVELSVSSYDTAWVAMVPSPNSPNSPCFPECLNWLMDNQLNNGSWGLLQHNPPFSLLKDTLSSTLASIVALRKWNVGEHQINKGLRFIESNIASVTDENQPSPIGYDIIFPHMLEYAVDLNIKLPLNQNDLSLMLHRRELELRRCHSKERAAYLAYISEGLGGFYDWKMVMKYQMKNGSILNSPSASAAALIHHQNAGCLDYLTSLLDKFGNAVPTVYPDLYVRLYMVDQLERLGVSRHFMVEIKTVLDEVYSYWLQRDEQIFMNAGTCALAFRVLRTNGYQISSDPLAEIIQDGSYMSPHEEPFEDTYAALEAYRASQIIYQDESAFGELNVLSAEFLKREISTAQSTHSKYIYKQVEDAFKFPFYAGLERVSTRRNIQNYNVDDTRTLKTTYCSSNISNEDYLRLAVEDFNSCQSIYREEFKVLERWVVENKLDKINSRQKMGYCYFSGASVLSSPELSDARIAWAKSSFLVTIVDDFFDVEGSVDELVNIIQCVEKWNVYVGIDCCSEEVRIMFLSIKDVVSWIGDKAYKWQERDVTSHVIQCWLNLLNSMLRLTEAKWARYCVVPTMNEYIETAYVSFTLGTFVLSSLYFIGPKLSEDIVQSSEYHNLYKLMSTHGRLINDIRSYKRELKDGKLNAVTLHKNYGKNGIKEEEIVEEIKTWIDNLEKNLMQLVLETKESSVPKACKDVFWKMCCVDIFFYATDDGFTGNKILDTVREVIYEPVSMLMNLTE